MKVTGIDFDGEVVKVAVLKKSFKKLSIHSLLEIPKENVKQLYKLKNKTVASGLKASDVLIHNFPMPLKGSQRKKALPFQIDSLSYLEKEERIDIPIFLEEEVACYSTIKSSLKSHIENLKRVSIDPLSVSFEASAMVRFAAYHLKNTEKTFLLHIGNKTSICVLMEDGMAKFSYNIPIGEENFIAGLKLDSQKIKIDISEENKRNLPELFSCLEQFIAEVSIALFFFQK